MLSYQYPDKKLFGVAIILYIYNIRSILYTVAYVFGSWCFINS